MRPRSISVVTAAVAIAQLGLAVAVAARGLPGAIPVHFDISGEANGWADRSQVALLLAGIALGMPGVIAAMRGRWARSAATEERQGIDFAVVGLLAVSCLLVGLLASLAFGWGTVHGGRSQAGPTALWLIMTVLGAILGKIPPNLAVGVRTPWSRASRLAWDKSNRLAGRLFFWGGLAGLACTPFLPLPVAMRLSLCVVLIFAGLAVLESWRVWRRDPDRRPI